MAKIREWTYEEVEKLKVLYSSNKTFEEIILSFPSRTSNAIRLKASRLGIRRPMIPSDVIQIKPLLFKSSNGDKANGYLIKCKQCSSWIQLEDNWVERSSVISCGECGNIYQVLTEL